MSPILPFSYQKMETIGYIKGELVQNLLLKKGAECDADCVL